MSKIFNTVLLFLTFSLVVLYPTISKPNLFNKSDLETNLLQMRYVRDTILNYHIMPQWNPYINQGLPIVGDPLNNIYYPLVFLVFMFPNYVLGVKIVYVVSLTLAGLFMYFLSRNRWIALTYMAAGPFVARVLAGHFEKVISYPLLPLFLLSLVRRNVFFMAIALSMIYFSADIYGFLYALIIFGVTSVVDFKNLLSYIKAFILFVCLSAVKLFPMLLVMPRLMKLPDPFSGSQNILSIAYHLFFPFKFILQSINLYQFVPTNFAWWEKLGFIGPVFLFTSICAIKNKVKLSTPLWVAIICMLAIAAPAASWNPFHWLISTIPTLSLFHVPTRVLAMLIIPILVLNRKVVWYVLLVNLILVLGVNFYAQIKRPLPDLLPGFEVSDHLGYIQYPAYDYPVSQIGAVENHQKLLSATYGVVLKDSPAASWVDTVVNGAPYQDIQPTYVATVENNQFVISRNASATPYVSPAEMVTSTKIIPNGITIQLKDHSKNVQITVLESMFPGWNALNTSRFLTKLVPAGTNIVNFVFNSQLYLVGLIVSVISFGWLCVKRYSWR